MLLQEQKIMKQNGEFIRERWKMKKNPKNLFKYNTAGKKHP